MALATGRIVPLVAAIWIASLRRPGRPPVAWTLALAAAAFRWGTSSLAGVTAAARTLAPAIAAGPALAVAGAWLALAGATLEISGRFKVRMPFLEQAEHVVSWLALAWALAVPAGAQSPGQALAGWVVVPCVLALVSWLGRDLASRIPDVVAVLACLAGTALIAAAT